jgi:hypothetical protein
MSNTTKEKDLIKMKTIERNVSEKRKDRKEVKHK